MLSDRKASELISQSMHRPLSDEEQREVAENLAQSEASRSFQKLSQAIHNSVAEAAQLAESGDESVSPGLSQAAKERLRDSIRAARSTAEKSATDGATDSVTQITSKSADGRHDFEAAIAEPQPGDLRELKSRFSLIRRLGDGGLGTVWLARDETLKRTVALKEIHPQALESPQAWERFHREAEITGTLEHPNVVPLYQFGTDAKTGQPFYVMRFLGKQTLADAIVEHHERRGEGDEDTMVLHRMLTAFLDVCQAIAYAHSRGVIHRDLKPENVASDHFGQVVVLDWGLAKLVEDGELATKWTLRTGLDDSALRATTAGDVIGTPLYMSPEQAAGRLDEIDERTDVYGLGAILFAILTGSAPHEHSCTSAGGTVRVEELLKAIAECDTPSAVEINPEVSRELADICCKAMSRRKPARHASASELAAEIERWMAGQNERRRRYETIRMEGREMRSALASTVRALETNARFMAALPPIQGIIDAELGRAGDDIATWRERLATIFKGLIQANSDFSAVAYSRVHEGEVRQIVRVQRHSTDYSNVRSVPLSRLLTTAMDRFVANAMNRDPEEVHVAIIDEPVVVSAVQSEPVLLLSAGVPVFDETSEEPFGLVNIECDVHRLVEQSLRSDTTQVQWIALISPAENVLAVYDKARGHQLEAERAAVAELVPEWPQIATALAAGEDYHDDGDFRVFATRLQLGAGENYVTIVVQ